MIRSTAARAHAATRPPRHGAGASLLALLFMLTACGGDGSGDSAGEAPAADAGVQGTTPTGPATADAPDRLELTIGDGPLAGTHEATGDMGCFAQPGIWGATLSRLGDPGISEVLLMVQGVPVTGGSSQQVDFTVTFGDVMTDDTGGNSGMTGIGAVAGGGTGTATVTPEGRGATIQVEGTTGTGAALTAVIRCGTVEVVQ